MIIRPISLWHGCCEQCGGESTFPKKNFETYLSQLALICHLTHLLKIHVDLFLGLNCIVQGIFA